MSCFDINKTNMYTQGSCLHKPRPDMECNGHFKAYLEIRQEKRMGSKGFVCQWRGKIVD